MSVKISYDVLNTILNELSNEYTIFAPKEFKQIGTYSEKDIIRYGEVTDAYSIIFDKKSDYSPKEIYFPITQTLIHFINNREVLPELDNKKFIIFMRPCDINSLNVFESIFLNNGSNNDSYYEELKDKVKIFMIECKDSFDSCFCVSMNMNKSDNYDIAMRFTQNEILCHIKSDEFLELFTSKGSKADFIPEYVEKDSVFVETPDINKISLKMFDDSLWNEYTSRCIGCGRCNFVCPTCTCWSMQDVKYEGHTNIGERRRVWASCHVDGYTDMAGGHSFRRSNGERMRFKVFHKIYDFKKRFGYNMCTGCGRCDDICPEYISYSNSINKVTKLTKGESLDGK